MEQAQGWVFHRDDTYEKEKRLETDILSLSIIRVSDHKTTLSDFRVILAL